MHGSSLTMSIKGQKKKKSVAFPINILAGTLPSGKKLEIFQQDS